MKSSGIGFFGEVENDKESFIKVLCWEIRYKEIKFILIKLDK